MDGALRTLTVVWLGLVAGVVVYTAVACGLLLGGAVDLALFGPAVVRWVSVGVIAYMMAAVLVRRRMVAAIPSAADAEVRLARYQTATIVGLALLESGGLVVITVAMLSGAPGWALAGGGASVWLMLLARPREEELRGRAPGR